MAKRQIDLAKHPPHIHVVTLGDVSSEDALNSRNCYSVCSPEDRIELLRRLYADILLRNAGEELERGPKLGE